MKNIIIRVTLLCVSFGAINLYSQVNSQIALGYTGIVVKGYLGNGFSTTILINPKNTASSYGAFFDLISTQKIGINTPNDNNAQFEMISTGARYQYNFLNKSKLKIDAGIGASYDRLRYIDKNQSGGISDWGIFTTVKNRETLSTANAMSLQPVFSICYNIKKSFGLKMEHRYRFALNDTSILNRSQLSGYQLMVALFHTF